MRLASLLLLIPALAHSSLAYDRLCADAQIAQRTGIPGWVTYFQGTVSTDQRQVVRASYMQGEEYGPWVEVEFDLNPMIDDSGDVLEMNVFRTVTVDGRLYSARVGVGTLQVEKNIGAPAALTTSFRLNLQHQIFRITLSNARECRDE